MASEENEQIDYEKVGEIVQIYARTGTFYVYYRRDGKTVRRSLKTASRKRARQLALQVERELEQAEKESNVRRLLDEVIDEYDAYLVGMKRASKTLGKYRHGLKLVKELAAERNVLHIDQVDHRFADAFRNRRAENASDKTVRNDLVLIRQVINFALKRKLLREDPLAGFEFGKIHQKPQPFWTKQQMNAIVAATLPRYRPYFSFLAETGVRCAEAIWLTWDDVDIENSIVHIRAKDGWRPKTGDERSIPMSMVVRSTLENMPRSASWVFTAPPSRERPQSGRQIDARRALSHLKTVLKRLGLEGHQHTFRHSFISHALTAGTPEAIVRDWVGHVDQKIIRRYTHIADQISRDAMSRLSDAAVQLAT